MQDKARYGSQGPALFKHSYNERRGTMIVERRTYAVKVANLRAIVEMIKEGHQVLDYTPPFRILLPEVSPYAVVVHELEFKDLAERQKFWTDWQAGEKAPAVIKKAQELFELGGGGEIWRIAE
jgi:hypothetical protein